MTDDETKTETKQIVCELDGKLFKDSVIAVAALCDEVRLRFTEEGLEIREMDPSQIALIKYVLGYKDMFHYSCPQPKTISVNIEELLKIAKVAKIGYKAKLTIKDKLTVSYDRERSYTLPLIEDSGDNTGPKLPAITYTAEIKLNAAILKDALKDLEDVGCSHVRWVCEEGQGLRMTYQGDELSAEAHIPLDKILQISLKKDAVKTVAQYSIEYLRNLLKATDKAFTTVQYGTDRPMQLDYSLSEHTTLTYFLAPRIETA